MDEWEIWNEPFGQGTEYAEMFYRTALAVREIQPTAKLYCTAITWDDYIKVLDLLKEKNALDLGSYFIYHPYDPHPESSYDDEAKKHNVSAVPLRKLVKVAFLDWLLKRHGSIAARFQMSHACVFVIG